MANKLLYPRFSAKRRVVDLSGIWDFKFDFKGEGRNGGWQNGLCETIEMPVPASFNDFFTEKALRDFAGDVWYQKEIYVPSEWKDYDLDLRFDAATHRATVYVNGKEITSHEGGFQPFNANLNDVVKFDETNLIVVVVNNELSRTSLPCGQTRVGMDGVKQIKPYFDFFNYAGLQRTVRLVVTPKESILDYSVIHSINGKDANVKYTVETNGIHDVVVSLLDEDSVEVANAKGKTGELVVKNARLWQVMNAYLYTIKIQITDGETLIDEYSEEIGIRTVEIKGNRLLINGSSVYLKGFGKHEDSDINGRGFSLNVIKRDFELMKWIGANSFRTSHYPYAEEIYQLADRYGIVVVDECAAVGMMESLMNALDAASANNNTAFFEYPEVLTETLKNHLVAVEDLINRDKNHACVCIWSLLNEPDTLHENAVNYFAQVFEKALATDPQKRPRTFAMLMSSTPDKCKCHQFADILALNRYYGWYVMGGSDIKSAKILFNKEMEGWERTGKPVFFSEYGADTVAGVHKLPSVMFSEEYQCEYLALQHEIFDKYNCVMGEQVWNFADFQTTEGIIRVDGNKKGIFTRTRQPKEAAHFLRARWTKLPTNYKS